MNTASVNNGAAVERLSYTIEDAVNATGLPRTRIYEAVRAKQLTLRKAGKASIILRDELAQFLRSLPAVGKQPEQVAA